MTAIRVCLEEARRRTFAAALDWPGWCRSGRTAEDALDALATYLPRYAEVATRAGLRLPEDAGAAPRFDVVDRVPGTTTTEFGAPDVVVAEAAYARKIGVRYRSSEPADPARVTALRADVEAALRTPSNGEP